MHDDCLPRYAHDHAFGQAAERPGERRTRWVIGLTAAMMLVEIAAGLVNAVSALLLQHDEDDHAQHHDHNLRSAYLHVLADALTSVLAIAALLCGLYLGWRLVDPLMGVLGALLVGRWSVGLARESAAVLLDRRAPPELLGRMKAALEREGDQVCDLHVWRVAPEGYAAIVGLLCHEPRSPQEYKRRLPADLPLRHVTVEVHPCVHPEPAA